MLTKGGKTTIRGTKIFALFRGKREGEATKKMWATKRAKLAGSKVKGERERENAGRCRPQLSIRSSFPASL